MSRQNLFAFTELTPNYPAFISVNQEEDAMVEITVRNGAYQAGGCGEMASIKLTPEQAMKLAYAILDMPKGSL